MTTDAPVLHLLCGKAASGKSTLAAQLADAPHTVLLSEDAWLSALFGDQMETLKDYAHVSAKLRAVMAPHIVELLGAGLCVVLDFPANTKETRQWMRGIIDTSGAAHELHLLDVADDVCMVRLRARNASGNHAFSVTDEQFDRLAAYFSTPSEDEGFTIRHHASG